MSLPETISRTSSEHTAVSESRAQTYVLDIPAATEVDTEKQQNSDSFSTARPQRSSFSHSILSTGGTSIKSAFGDYLEVSEPRVRNRFDPEAINAREQDIISADAIIGNMRSNRLSMNRRRRSSMASHIVSRITYENEPRKEVEDAIEDDEEIIQEKLERDSSTDGETEYKVHDNDLYIKEDDISAKEALPPFGGGKQYPELLPNCEDYTVEWDGPDDPDHPYNWTIPRKIPVALINGLNIIVVCWGSSVYSGGMPQVREEFGVDQTIGLLGISVYILGFASGPIIWAPASELFGRKFPQILSLLGFTIFSAASAVAKDIQTLLITRFFTGFLGAAPLAIVPAVYSDVFPAATRGYILAIFSFAVYFGPMLGPIVGSFIAKNPAYGWRWTEYVTAMMGGVCLVLNIFFLEESYSAQLLIQKARRLRRITGNWGIQARQERVELNFDELVSKNLVRPIKMLCTEPILFLINLFQSFLYGIMYMLLEAYPIVFHDGYGMHQGQDILPYFALIFGQFLGCLICLGFEPYYLRRLNQNGGKAVPEARLPANIVGGIFLPIGLLWFAWSGNYPESVHWMVPCASGVATGIALTTIFLCCTTYLVDCYTQFAASAMAANVFMRSLFGFGFPLFATQMFENLGVGWAGTLLGLIGVLMAPVPLFFYIYGPKIRARSKYTSL